ETLRRAREHPVLAGELFGHALDRALDAERLAAADAMEWLFLLETAGGRGRQSRIARRGPRKSAASAARDCRRALRSGTPIRRRGKACIPRRRSRRRRRARP